MRKHVTQLTKKEKQYLTNRFKGVKHCDWKWTEYSQGRLIERQVDLKVMNTIWSEGFDIVEFHFDEKKKHKRLLLRSICTDEKDNQVCVVFNFTTMEIHTVYLNERSNKHQNVFHSEYDINLDVITLMKTKFKDAFIYS